MPPSRDIAPKKLPKQRRAIATVEALSEAATYILAREGAGGFTANKVAEKAGVNIASFYQYFPNKEALLFHVATSTWERQTLRLSRLLARPGNDHAAKLRDFIRAVFLVEADEADLRRALRAASVDLKDTDAFRSLMAAGSELTRGFIAGAIGADASGDPDFIVRFIVLAITSFAERTTDEGTCEPDLIRQADLLTDMLAAQFGIS